MLTSLFPGTHSRYTSLPILGRILKPLCKWLATQGYPPKAIQRRVQSARLLDFLLQKGAVNSLKNVTAKKLISCFPREDRWTPQIACALGRSLIQYLEEQGKLAKEAPTVAEELVETFREFLGNVRGLAPISVNKHAAVVTELLEFLDFDKHRDVFHDLKIRKIDEFLVKASRHWGRVSMMDVTGILRAFLRFLATKDEVEPGLAAKIESPRLYRGERLPRAIPWETVQKLLNSIDRGIPKGKRDFAILLLIATYGLRISEIVTLSLDDISWRDRRIRVPRPKVGNSLDFPLTDEIATALLDYLRNSRPKSQCRRLFLRVRIPIGPLESSAITDVFEAWAMKARIALPGHGGPHCLRHSLAMHLLRKKTPLKIISDILGHRSAESTGIYLRLEVEDLRDVALPLPKTVSGEMKV